MVATFGRSEGERERKLGSLACHPPDNEKGTKKMLATMTECRSEVTNPTGEVLLHSNESRTWLVVH